MGMMLDWLYLNPTPRRQQADVHSAPVAPFTNMV